MAFALLQPLPPKAVEIILIPNVSQSSLKVVAQEVPQV